MADKTTTLKTQTGDNVYPNVLDKNIPDSIVRGVELNAVQENLNNKIAELADAMKGEIDSKQNISYYHFITMTDNTSTFYLTYQNTSDEELITLDSLKTALTGKCLLCTGHTDTETAEYISGEGANIVVAVADTYDNSTSGITIDSSFTITDLVSPVR